MPVAKLTPRQAVDRCRAIARSTREPALVVTPNVDHFLRWQRDADFRAIYDSSALSVPDGMPLVWMLRLLGRPGEAHAERVTGVDLFLDLAATIGHDGGAIAIIGGVDGAAAAAARRLAERFPGLRVVFTAEPSPDELTDDAALAGLAAHLLVARPELVALCLGSPKQERLFRSLRQHGAPPAVYLGVGAAADFAAGRISRAPRVVQNAGLEWAFRILMEPRRLWRRYLIDGAPVVIYLARSVAAHIIRARRVTTARTQKEALHALHAISDALRLRVRRSRRRRHR